MKVECSQQIDAGEPDENGFHDYIYAYESYKFSIDELTLIARSYLNEPKVAHFLSIDIEGKTRPLTTQDLDCDLMRQAKTHLKTQGKTKLEWLNHNAGCYLRF